ncbi:hypothetical protein [Breznakiella homolactica]|uniref:Uncharacterized protein n=1 Tax=Breznakiella homolactica TaxID=2798577 RepID=A0A7T8BBQ4_9SPIR|nr:hypothetical protein [Breznakiella homolactica]QQO10310.1 hypothetical protein JFL75_05160 [Breznakiella homolactica]
MDIRTTERDYPVISKAFRKCSLQQKEDITVTRDSSLSESCIMVKTDEGTLTAWTFGRKNILSYLQHGAVFIRNRCPFSLFSMGKCRTNRCQLYHIRNQTGDCALIWNLFIQ